MRVKKALLLLSTLLLVLLLVPQRPLGGSLATAALDPKKVSPTTEFYVADYANVLSQETKDFILATNRNYEKTREKPQIVVLTVPDLGPYDRFDFAQEIFQRWGIGDKNYKNGVLILRSTKNGDTQTRIHTGYGLEGILNDAKAGRILDYSRENLTGNKNNDLALKTIFYQVAQEVNKEYDYEEAEIFKAADLPDPLPARQAQRAGLNPLFRILLMLLLFSFLFGGRGGRGGRGGGSILPWILLNSLGGRGGSGGFGGGGFGGGGGSFGGGGSSGGGGAGRGF